MAARNPIFLHSEQLTDLVGASTTAATAYMYRGEFSRLQSLFTTHRGGLTRASTSYLLTTQGSAVALSESPAKRKTNKPYYRTFAKSRF